MLVKSLAAARHRLAALERLDLSCMYLADHELESVIIIIIIIVIIIIIIIIVVIIINVITGWLPAESAPGHGLARK